MLRYASHVLLDFELVQATSECVGKESLQGNLFSAEACADACRGSSQMFVYGTNQFGNNRCDSNTCACWCQLETINNRCKTIAKHTGFNLYGFKLKGIDLNKESIFTYVGLCIFVSAGILLIHIQAFLLLLIMDLLLIHTHPELLLLHI